MKRKVFLGFLIAEAAICVLLVFLKISVESSLPVMMAFPFQQIGAGLRALSLSSGFGNALAIALYALVSVLPIGVLLRIRQKRTLQAEDSLLVFLSAALFYVLYQMINPSNLLNLPGSSASLAIGKAILGSLLYSLLIGYIMLRVLRLFYAGTLQKLEHYIAVMLGVISAGFIIMAFGVSLHSLVSSIASLQAGNMGNEQLLGLSYVFLGLQYLVNALPHILSTAIVFAALRLLAALQTQRYSTESVQAAQRLSRLCAIALAVTVLTNILFNLLQTLFSKSLMVVNQTVQIPVVSLLFVLVTLLLTRILMESKQLKEENEQFI